MDKVLFTKDNIDNLMENLKICLIPKKQRNFLIVSLLHIIWMSYMTVPDHQNLITG